MALVDVLSIADSPGTRGATEMEKGLSTWGRRFQASCGDSFGTVVSVTIVLKPSVRIVSKCIKMLVFIIVSLVERLDAVESPEVDRLVIKTNPRHELELV